MSLKVKPNDDTGLWEIHDECGHLCNLESESTAQDISQAVNMLPKLVKALERAASIIEDIPYPGDYAAKDLRAIIAEISDPMPNIQGDSQPQTKD